MTQIDLSKAPEGATHYGEGNHCKFWAKDVRPGISYQFSNVYHDGPTGWMIRLGDPDYPVTSIIPDWTGEGLPPAGTVCERSYGGEWRKTTVCGHSPDGQSWAAFYDDDKAGWLSASGFRPIRTPSQLAAEEREKAITDIALVMGKDPDRPFIHERAAVLYDAGYRKVEVKP